MLSVLVCDDEQNICHLIVRLIQWEQLELGLVGTAQNGKDALDLIVEKKPDIVLTDIRMPVYNGIELATKVRMLGIDSHFIVISGYDNFSYAQDALKAQVSDYLLKPINAQELNDTLSRVSKQILQERAQQNLVDNIEGRLHSISNVQRNIFMKNVISGNSSVYSADMLRECGLSFTGDMYNTLIVVFDVEKIEDYASILSRQISKLCSSLSSDIYPCFHELLLYAENNQIYGVFNYSDGQSSVVHNYMGDIYYACRRACAVLPNVSITLAVGSPVSSPSQLSESMYYARNALRCRINLGTDKLIFYNEVPSELLSRPRLDCAVTTRLRSSLDLCDAESLENIIRGIFCSANCHSSYFQLALELLNFIQKEQRNSESGMDYYVDEPAMYDKTYGKLEAAFSPEQLAMALIDYCHEIFDTVDRRVTVQTSQPIELAKKYIAENYAGECSLQDIANYAHLSANYLSSTFKKKTGVSMNAYIAVVRINEAKRLLKESDEGVYDIGERVGYHDPKHFRKVFKENVGISPAKYRSLYR